jgi:hypothetical protein
VSGVLITLYSTAMQVSVKINCPPAFSSVRAIGKNDCGSPGGCAG